VSLTQRAALTPPPHPSSPLSIPRRLNEILARQMYTGRKWFVERYPGLDSAVVAFHQDGPLRALQMPQVYAKAGMRYLKQSRLTERIVRWTAPDGVSGLLSFPQLHYCVDESAIDAQDILYRLALYAPQYREFNLPPILPVTVGCDYAPPYDASAVFAGWEAASQRMNNSLPALQYSTFRNALDALSGYQGSGKPAGAGTDSGAASASASAKSPADPPVFPSIIGERPNLWIYENSPTHHRMWSSYRDAGRLLPAAESFSAFAGLLLDGSFAAYPSDTLDAAWLNLTLDDHGISCEPVPKNQGLPTWLVNDNSPPQWDMLYAEKWADALAAGVGLLANATARIATAVADRPPSPAPADAVWSISVFNTLSWTRSDPVLDLPPPPSAGGPFAVLDAETGEVVPSQVAANGSLLFVAPNVPSMGYKTFWLAPVAETAADAAAASSPPPTTLPTPGTPWTTPFSNNFYTVTPGRGGLASVVDLASGSELFDTASGFDAGEWMSLQYTGMGASETRSTPFPSVNQSAFQRLGNLSVPLNFTCTEAGPVRVVFSSQPVPTAHSLVQLVVELYAEVKRFDVRVNLLAWDGAFGVVNRVVFPLKTTLRNISYAVPFGVVRVGQDDAEDGFDDVWLLNPYPTTPRFERAWAIRPREIGDWIRSELSGDTGVTLSSSVGAFDWVDVTGTYPSVQPVLAPEMLVSTNSNRGPFLPEPGEHSFLFSLTATTGTGGWADGWKAGVAPNNPLVSVALPVGGAGSRGGTGRSGRSGGSGSTAGGGGASADAAPLPFTHAFLNLTSSTGQADPDVWVTAAKKEDGAGRDGVIVRVVGIAAEDLGAVGVHLNLFRPLTGAATTNLIELEPQEIPGAAGRDGIDVVVGKWSIETVRLDVV
jgi:alpha-mannosidase